MYSGSDQFGRIYQTVFYRCQGKLNIVADTELFINTIFVGIDGLGADKEGFCHILGADTAGNQRGSGEDLPPDFMPLATIIWANSGLT